MNDIENQSNRYNEEPMRQPRKSGGWKNFLSMVTAGVVGSVLTLGAVTLSDTQGWGVKADETAGGTNRVENAASLDTVPVSADGTPALADIVENASKAIVGIVNIQNQNQNHPFSRTQGNVESGSGSGVIFKKQDGNAFIVTNNHVIEGASKLEVSLYNGKKADAEVVGADPLTDLAVIKIDGKFVEDTIEFGDSSQLRPGDQVLAIGNPLGLDLSRTVTQGIVSAIDRGIEVSTSAGVWELNVIQTDAAINPGNSGGALINTAGQVIGINSLKISESGVEGLGFAIPSNDVLPIINELIKTGQVARPYLGVSLADLAQIPEMYKQNLPEDVDAGTMITYVDPQSPAAEAGLRKQDVIVSINGEEVSSSADLRKHLYSKGKNGNEVKLKIYRDGKAADINVSLSSKNAEA
ncbi:trypsin-like peptidase domain-containing protein [Bacillus sp. FJAT-27251]|uniref:S1C family serine protease n=1 Tax=Bacillus sp. FJAT-27251 TaxID=1684142 RepID=UPI001E4D69DC|nr:trypsin-like peptidase domain-containing protein [Bacillus sp. FJAT-27251]